MQLPGAPPEEPNDDGDLTQEELLNKTVYIPYRAKKDPRDLKILDPACGSGHFLLYAFDLLRTIYEEGWQDDGMPVSEGTGQTLSEDYPDLQTLAAALPGLILRHNLHGIDIDPRAAQIAAFALWMRVQRAYNEADIARSDRPVIAKTNIVVAEPMPGEKELLQEFTRTLRPRVLGQLVEVVFDKMQLAGEAGSLLKIEEEIRDAIAEAKALWQEGSKPEQLSLFGDTEKRKVEQLQLFDVSGITDEQFWNEAEQQIYSALHRYAEMAANGSGYRRKLFADDAIRGFGFIDICRESYNVVLMNPPFGEFAKQVKEFTRTSYPNTSNDIFAAFIERFSLKTQIGGILGAITSRVGFYLSSFSNWRNKLLIDNHSLRLFADLGEGVMDDAMVETAAYCLSAQEKPTSIIAIRLLGVKNREMTLRRATKIVVSGQSHLPVFVCSEDVFHNSFGKRFIYWVNPKVIKRISELPTLEPEAGHIRQGLVTSDNTRFVRALWEVPIAGLSTNGKGCGSGDRWVPLVMAGESQPWFSPISVVLNWRKNGQELRAFVEKWGHPSRRIVSEEFYFRPGLSWTLRANRLIPYVIPSGCIHTASRYMAFPKSGRELEVLGVLASNLSSAILRFGAEKFARPKFLVETLKSLPWPCLPDDTIGILEKTVFDMVYSSRRAYQTQEAFQEFVASPFCFGKQGSEILAFDYLSFLNPELENDIDLAYTLTPVEAHELKRDLYEALEMQITGSVNIESSQKQESIEDGRKLVISDNPIQRAETHISYIVGCCFGRWDVRIGKNPDLAPKQDNPFDPLPICPPGMLIGVNGLPAKKEGIVSEEWLISRRKTDEGDHPNSVANSVVGKADYPIQIPWTGILIDDAGHNDDIADRISEIADKILSADTRMPLSSTIACINTNITDFRSWFQKFFFDRHIKDYSKSRRKAPIYWQLATPSASYSVWLYYHRFTKDTFYTVLNDYVTPKLQHEERKLTNLVQEAGPNPSAGQRKDIDAQETFVEELRGFRAEVARIAPLWNPNLNDGVIINFAPLWRLVPQHRAWQKECRDCWEKLVAGDYDWAHLSMHLWPERVVPKCATDRSLAIAHDLEDVFWEEGEDGKWAPRDVSVEEVEKLIAARTSSAVKEALNDLLAAPSPVGGRKRSRKRKS